MDDFLELKRKKERGLSNKEFFAKAAETFEGSQAIVIVSLGANDDIETWRSSDSSLMALGLLATATNAVLKEQEG